ncbi:MAG: NlpC/P60 family protein [Lachnospiraceae bacterium]
MKKLFLLSMMGILIISTKKTVLASASNFVTTFPTVGVAVLLEEEKSIEDYIESAKESAVYGYNNVGIANVDNHLNIRQEPIEGSKILGKMSNNAACEIIEIVGDWAKITSGDVEGYVHLDYLFTGMEARIKAEEVVSNMAIATSGGLRVRKEPNTESEIITQIGEGERLEVAKEEDGWVAVYVDNEVAYVSADYVEVSKKLPVAMTMTEVLYGVGVSDVRVEISEYAKQFIGNPYVWGGTSLTKGADCSGFVQSVFKNYGISLNRSSRDQAKQGTSITGISQAKPGDLIFYASGGTINHVAIYIGGNQVVHASNPKTGIRISNVNYRTIHSIRRVIND